MTRNQAAARILEGLGFRSDTATLNRAISRLQEAQRFYEQGKTLPWFLIAEAQVVNLVAGNSSVTLPEGFIREVDYESMRYFPEGEETIKFIPRKTLNEALEAYSDRSPGAPLVYALRETSVRFFPEPDTNYTLSWSYYKRAAALTTDIENEWLADTAAPELLIGEAGYRLARNLRDKEAAADFLEMKSNAQRALFGEIVTRELSMGAGAMGENL